MNTPLAPGAAIGIVGGGQLGRMSAIAAARLGYRCHIYAPEPSGPASQVAARTCLGAYDDLDALRDFARGVEVVTFEFENVSAAGLDALAGVTPVHPSPAILRTSQDRVVEKTFFERAGAKVGDWQAVEDRSGLDDAVARIGLPSVLKTTRLGYDGRGQAVLRSPEDLDAAWSRLAPKPLILEKFVDFACEISVIVARNAAGAIAAFDAVENRHRHHILDLTLAPAQVTPDIAEAARTRAIDIAEGLCLVGLLAIEMFVDPEGRVLVNEMAPRPHNSGHWTIDACPASQFEMHVRAIAGLPLPPATRHADAVMKNLVGPDDMALWPDILATPGLIPHHYGKAEARPGRKMGHVTRLFPRGSLPGAFGIEAALGVLGKG
jgi:5-(carboxyamino)imidazole ribonucleotide synthase